MVKEIVKAIPKYLKNIIRMILFAVSAIIVPLLIDFFVFGNSVHSNINNEAWASFLGSYIGGLCTMAAVFITISYNEKQRKLQQVEQIESDKNRVRLSIRPYIETNCAIFDKSIVVGTNDKVLRIEGEKPPVQSHISEAKKRSIRYNKEDVNNDTIYVNYIIRNIGAGSAVDMMLNINNYQENMSIAKGETVQILCILEGDIRLLTISLSYYDVEQLGYYKKEDSISIIENNGEKYPLINHLLAQQMIQR